MAKMTEKLGYDELYKMRLELIRERNLLKERMKLTKGLIQMALDELGVPGEGYPAPVSNAVDFLKQALECKEIEVVS